MDGERRALDARLFGVGGVEHLDAVVVLLGPADVHPHQHLGPIGGVDATRTGADGDDGLALVVLAGQQGPDLHLFDVGLQRFEFGVGLGELVVATLFGRQFVEHRQILEAAAQAFDATQFTLGVGEFTGDALGVALVVPQIGGVGGLVFELLDLRAQPIDVEHSLHRRQGGVEGGDI